jgi:hypothetical protein
MRPSCAARRWLVAALDEDAILVQAYVVVRAAIAHP